MRPTCGKCGLEMTRENSRHRPELFLHDTCLPEELRPKPKKPAVYHEKIQILVDLAPAELGELHRELAAHGVAVSGDKRLDACAWVLLMARLQEESLSR